jgi:hypothetical protein
MELRSTYKVLLKFIKNNENITKVLLKFIKNNENISKYKITGYIKYKFSS